MDAFEQDDNYGNMGSISYLREGDLTGPRDMYVSDTLKLQFIVFAVGMTRMEVVSREGIHQPIPGNVIVHKLGVGPAAPEVVAANNDYIHLSWDHNYNVLVGNVVFFTLNKQKQHCVGARGAANVMRLRAEARRAADIVAEANAAIEAAEIAAISLIDN